MVGNRVISGLGRVRLERRIRKGSGDLHLAPDLTLTLTLAH